MIGSGTIKKKYILKQSTVVETLLFPKGIFKSGFPKNAVINKFLTITFTQF